MASYSLKVEKLEWFGCKKKANPSVNKLLKEYRLTLTPSGADATPIEDKIVWAAKGAGRDWYPADLHPIGLKMHRDGPQYTANETEWELYQKNEVVRANAPRFYGHYKIFVEEHDFSTPVRVNVLVQEKVGESLGRILGRLCKEETWNHHGAKVEAISMWEKTLVLTDNLSLSGVGWAQDFHQGNVNLSLCGGRMVWIDLEAAGQTSKGHVDNLRMALSCLKKYIDLPVHWQRFHDELIARLNRFLSQASTADTCKGWWKDCLREALGADEVPAHISTAESAAAASDTYTQAASPFVLKQPSPLWQPAPWTLKSIDASGTDTAAASPGGSLLPQPAPWKQNPADASLPGGTATAASGTDTAAASPGGSSSGTDTAAASSGTDAALPGVCQAAWDWTWVD